jgi:phytoene desaturase
MPTLDRRIDGLVFCGSNTQPGVGVPMVLISGRLAAERITGAG